MSQSALRPRDADALRAELRSLSTSSGVPIVFGGEVHEDALLLSEFVGTWTNGLKGLLLPPKSGLGGRVMDLLRPLAISDYYSSSSITHQFDRPVSDEGIRSVVAAPVVVDGVARAVLYAANRGAALVGDRTTDLVVQACRRLAHEIRIRDEVDRRTRLLEGLHTTTEAPQLTEELREINAELRSLAQSVEDSGIQRRLRNLSERLARAISGEPATGDPIALAPREVDVLAQVALGCSNSEVARRLSLRPETVKSYLPQRDEQTRCGFAS